MSGLIKNCLRTAAGAVNHLLWPCMCISCGEKAPEQQDCLCSDCWQELAQLITADYCSLCGKELSRFALINSRCANCLSLESPIEALSRVGIYAGPMRTIILKFKNGSDELIHSVDKYAWAALEGAGFAGQIQAFVPVPLHWTKRLQRGYNQAQIIASRLAANYNRKNRPSVSTDLVRMRKTPPQYSILSPAGKAANVAGAFKLRADHRLAGKTVCLVDDIRTSGSTLAECAKTLKQAGIAKVYAFVLATARADAGGVRASRSV